MSGIDNMRFVKSPGGANSTDNSQTKSLPRTESIKSFLIQVGRIRDGLLVIGAILYGFGYATWAMHAWINHLGPVAGLDAQYFVAGIPVLFVLTLGWWTGNLVASFYLKTWPAWLDRRPGKVQLILMLSIGLFVISTVVIGYLRKPPKPSSPAEMDWYPLVLFLIVAPFAALLRSSPLGDGEPNPFVILNRSIVVGLSILAASAYLRFAYPNIPQALGGGRPRSAVLDLYCGKMSPRTYELLGTSLDSCVSGKIVQTRVILVYYESKENLLVAPEDSSSTPRMLFDLKKETIATIKWAE